MKNFIVVLGIILAFVAGYFVSQKYNFKIESKSQPEKTTVSPKVETKTPSPTEKPLVGNDTDEYGCKPSAGYSWCEAKKKCIREWEESCDEEEEIAQALAAKNGWNTTDIVVTVSKADGQFARGSVKEKSSEVGGGMFLAVKKSDKWQIVFDGNGAPDCTDLKSYLFPKDFLAGICD